MFFARGGHGGWSLHLEVPSAFERVARGMASLQDLLGKQPARCYLGLPYPHHNARKQWQIRLKRGTVARCEMLAHPWETDFFTTTGADALGAQYR